MGNEIGLYLPQSQIDSLKSGNRFTTCEPKERVEKIDNQLVSRQLKGIGQIFDVADEGGKIQTRARLIDCFITTFGKPDPRFVSGMGFGLDYKRMQSEYSKFWHYNFPDMQLTESTELFVTIWEPVQ